jgi:predicted RNase H-like nuclease
MGPKTHPGVRPAGSVAVTPPTGRRRRSSGGGGVHVVGVDGCSGGWVAVALRDGVFESTFTSHGVAEVLTHYASAKVVGIDIPIGAERGRFRRTDAAAKKLLGRRGSTLFETPPLEVLELEDFQAALALCRKLTGRGFSKQGHALRARILEATALAEGDRRLIEVHPELSFRAMAGRRLLPPKKTWNGASERRALLEAAGVRLPRDLGRPGLEAAVDDVLDAAAAAWTAHRFATGRAECLQPVVRARGRKGITIWS